MTPVKNSQPPDGRMPIRPALHFVGFRGEEYWSAVKVWGVPDFIHIGWDRYAMHAIDPQDTVIFARGDWTQEPNAYGYPDMKRGPLHLYD
ncbi:hypothetical protein [Novosphingobium rosa]|uniref:hypothetical protein n=1 Tax=Novosphingobium rosa TaxID=76978 RepID=UPI000B038052|nr:hypothetical protein [Novosphingobium rosa]